MKFALRYTVPVALSLFTIVLAIWSIHTNGKFAVDRVEKDTFSKLINILTLLQDSVEYEIRENNLERVQQEITGFSSDDNLKSLILVNEVGKVLAATQFSNLGLDVENIIPDKFKNNIKDRMRKVKAKYSSEIFPGPDHNILWGISPVRVGIKQGYIRPNKIGFLIAQIDLVEPRASALNLVKVQVFQFVFFLGFLVVGLGVFIHFQMTRRIQKLVSATESFARGNFDAKVDVGGRDEITALAQSMSEMGATRKWVENELKKSEETNRSVIENAIDGIISFDGNGKVLSLNPSAERIFCYRAEDIIGKDIKLLMPEPYEGESSNLLHYSPEPDEKSPVRNIREFWGQRRDDSKFPIEFSTSRMNMDSRLVFTIIVRDISARKNIEEELERYSSELKSANEELEKFVYTASHDLQEPLRKVIIFGDRLEEACFEKLEDNEKNYIHSMQKASFRMKDLITDLLDYSKMKYRIDSFEPVDLNSLTREVIEDLEAQIMLSEGKVRFSKLPVIDGDRIQLRQLFQNLISNSLKYVKDKVPPIISIECTAGNDQCYKISFLDNGIGFDEKYTDKVFEPFQRLHPSKDIRGTGMGMFICKKIIERHHGTITVRSAPNKGSTFIVTLPVKQFMVENN